jgi:predicted phage terminase large subunit-like protein
MKSIICSIALPAYLLGKDPRINIVCVSYNDDLTSKFANDCRNIMQSDWYKEVFPRTRIKPSRRAVNDFETTAGGGRMATSIGGTLTGRGADWIIIDDPMRASDAESELQREKVNDWYGSTLYSRLNNKTTGKILLLMQRLHQNDLTGYLLDSKVGFVNICLPVIAQEKETWVINNRIMGTTRTFVREIGSLLHSNRENMDVIAELRKSMGEIAFAGQYQQCPSPREGAIIKKEWMHYYNELPKEFDMCFLSWDTAVKTGSKNAYSACVVFGVFDNKIYVLDCFRARLEFPDLIKNIQELHLRTPNRFGIALPGGYYCGDDDEDEDGRYYLDLRSVLTLIEDQSSGSQAIQQICNSDPAIKIEAIRPTTDKTTRLASISSFIENGTVLFPNVAGHWWTDFSDELLRFPNSTFKDQCDAFSQGVEYIAKKIRLQVNIRKDVYIL